MQKHEGNKATIYYLDMLGNIIVGIPLLLLLAASGIIQHPAVVCQAAVQCGVVELVLATRKTRCQGYPPCAGCCRAGRQGYMTPTLEGVPQQLRCLIVHEVRPFRPSFELDQGNPKPQPSGY